MLATRRCLKLTRPLGPPMSPARCIKSTICAQEPALGRKHGLRPEMSPNHAPSTPPRHRDTPPCGWGLYCSHHVSWAATLANLNALPCPAPPCLAPPRPAPHRTAPQRRSPPPPMASRRQTSSEDRPSCASCSCAPLLSSHLPAPQTAGTSSGSGFECNRKRNYAYRNYRRNYGVIVTLLICRMRNYARSCVTA
jgi:hypothetical protein